MEATITNQLTPRRWSLARRAHVGTCFMILSRHGLTPGMTAARLLDDLNTAQFSFIIRTDKVCKELADKLGRFPTVRSGRSDQSVLKWNARGLRTGSGQNVPAHGSEPLSSPAPVGQRTGIWRVVGGKNVRARLAPFNLNWLEPVVFGRTERTNGKRPQRQSTVQFYYRTEKAYSELGNNFNVLQCSAWG